MSRVIIGLFVFLMVIESYGQSGVGIGTSNPNPNAVLDIVSSSNDKGILIPRLSTSQRNGMVANLTTAEVGLLVFDSELNTFFFWNGTAWSTINIVQDLQLTGNTLSITNNASATVIDLAPFAGTNTDNQTLTLTGTNLDISGGNTVDLAVLQDGVNDADADPANEIQDISTSGAAGNISLSSGSTLNLNTNDADADPANEIQNLSSTAVGTNRTVNITGGAGTTFSVADNDNSASNEIQDISTSGTAGNISLSSGSTLDLNVNDADANPTNEIQDLTLVGSTLRITNNAAATDIDLSPFAGTNTDNQTLSITGTNLSITGGNSVDLSGVQDGVNDADADPANELQTIAKVGSTVTLSNGGGSFTDAVNDADANPSNEIQTLSKVGSTVSLSNGGGSFTDETNDADADPSNEFQTISKTGSTVTLSNGGGSFNDDTGTDDQRLSLAGTVLTIEDGNNVNLAVIQDGVTDADADPAGAIEDHLGPIDAKRRTDIEQQSIRHAGS